MTTIISIRTKNSVFIGADTQVSEGNIKLPFLYPKIKQIGENILIGGSGGVGNLQQVLNRAIKNLFLGSILSENYYFEISLKSLVRELSNLNFELPLEYKHFSPFSFLLVGNEEGKNFIYSVGDDGSSLEIPTYYSIGSGCQLALGLLNNQYSFEMSDEEVITLLYEVFKQINKSDIYTNDSLNILMIDKKGKISNCFPS